MKNWIKVASVLCIGILVLLGLKKEQTQVSCNVPPEVWHAIHNSFHSENSRLWVSERKMMYLVADSLISQKDSDSIVNYINTIKKILDEIRVIRNDVVNRIEGTTGTEPETLSIASMRKLDEQITFSQETKVSMDKIWINVDQSNMQLPMKFREVTSWRNPLFVPYGSTQTSWSEANFSGYTLGGYMLALDATSLSVARSANEVLSSIFDRVASSK